MTDLLTATIATFGLNPRRIDPMMIRKRTALNGDTWWHCPACGAIHALKADARARGATD